jgi:hypothetical protein
MSEQGAKPMTRRTPLTDGEIIMFLRSKEQDNLVEILVDVLTDHQDYFCELDCDKILAGVSEELVKRNHSKELEDRFEKLSGNFDNLPPNRKEQILALLNADPNADEEEANESN